MKFRNTFCLLGLATAITSAAPVNGVVWSVPASTAMNVPAAGSVPGSGASILATFAAGGISFSGDTNYTLGGFLSSGAAQGIAYMNGASAATDLNNTLWEFTGSAFFTHGQTFSALHDDGLKLYVAGTLVLDQPGPTAPISQNYTFNGTTGNQAFDFIYGECCGGAADFSTTLVPAGQPVSPEPSTAVLLGSALFLVAGIRIVLGRRKLESRTRMARLL